MKDQDAQHIINWLDGLLSEYSGDRGCASHLKKETVNSPEHYQSDKGMEAIDVIEAFNLNFNLGNVVKYVLRAGKKDGQGKDDLMKALWYLERQVGQVQ
jgi:hypothetical protein